MNEKAFVLQNKGMNRDLSISKAGESSAYENHNIRITARDHDTLLSVTNERGNKEIPLIGIVGTLIGWNVLNEHIILFTHDETEDEQNPDYIYCVTYTGNDFEFRTTKEFINGETITHPYLFNGNLNFDCEHPIESVVYFETEAIQKIYWVDGKNVLRFMNFMADDAEIELWRKDNTFFDSNRSVKFDIDVEVSKDNSGNTRANGVIQYLLTYYNEHGQESGYVWISDLIYLSPIGVGGAADSTNNNSVTLTISELDTRFTHFRVYSVFRSALNGQTQAYIVYEGTTSRNPVIVVDNAAHLVAQDSSRLLYLGSQDVKAGTLAHKDQVLFLGDLQSIGNKDYEAVEYEVNHHAFYNRNTGKSNIITFEWSGSDNVPSTIESIPYHASKDAYSYESQLANSSSQITSFKGNERYRFALMFRRQDGTATQAFWIGDAINTKYPIMDLGDNRIQRIVAKCTLPRQIVVAAKDAGYKTVQLMRAEATYADRSVKAQGIINPTMFNVWERYNDRLYAVPSWITRPRGSSYAWKHAESVKNSTSSLGEIECNYWKGTGNKSPFYRLENYMSSSRKYMESFDGMPDYDHLMIIYTLYNPSWAESVLSKYDGRVTVVFGKLNNTNQESQTALNNFVFTQELVEKIENSKFDATSENKDSHAVIYSDEHDRFTLKIYSTRYYRGSNTGNDSRESVYNTLVDILLNAFNIPSQRIVSNDTFHTWCNDASDNSSDYRSYNLALSSNRYGSLLAALNNSDSSTSDRWFIDDLFYRTDSISYVPSYYKKHLMFVDENAITLNSPELDYESTSFDNVEGYKLRIIGAAKITGGFSDYTVEASPGKWPGENLVHCNFSGFDASSNQKVLLSWPIWEEYGLKVKEREEGADEDMKHPDDIVDYTSTDYEWGDIPVRYWLHMWNRAGKIHAFSDENDSSFSTLNRKVFANLHYSYSTIYSSGSGRSYDLQSLRVFNYTSSQYVNLKVGSDTKYYDAVVRESLMVPGELKYPVLYSTGNPSESSYITSTSAFLYSKEPVQITFAATPHAVMTLPSVLNMSDNTYTQTILPRLFQSEIVASYGRRNNTVTGNIAPWVKDESSTAYPDYDYLVNQSTISFPSGRADSIRDTDRYVYIGEIYCEYNDFRDSTDPRYGGVSDAAIQNCRFIPAGKQYLVDSLAGDGTDVIYGTEGDTYFQRYDCLKTKPYSTGAVNNVIDVTSVMLETHINIDGRTDKQRGTKYLASIDTEEYGSLNPVYSQNNNFYVSHDLDDDSNLDSYRSSITWSLEKHDSEEVDEWSHVTLASTLKLDGDKGICRAIRRFQNSLIAFQDKGISEVLFNSRTQLSTTNGVPVEIANSGKVDGKRYISNKFGCTNKWSIVEGRDALYFVDNINKAFCGFGGEGIGSLSTRLGFDVWFRNSNKLEPWNPKGFNNIVSYYDHVNADVYLVKGSDDEMSSLVYNENLRAFTSFFDYGYVPMMTNVKDRFVSFKNGMLWLQNEGLYCNFFGTYYPFWVQYRVTPDPFQDKVWTNIDYRADVYEVLDSNGSSVVPEEYMINGDDYNNLHDLYKEHGTFDYYKVWDEYQTTGNVNLHTDTTKIDPVRKKFRIWRLVIPRALKKETNKHGLDRLRNPWVNILFKKDVTDGKNLMQIHDFVVKYFE